MRVVSLIKSLMKTSATEHSMPLPIAGKPFMRSSSYISSKRGSTTSMMPLIGAPRTSSIPFCLISEMQDTPHFERLSKKGHTWPKNWLSVSFLGCSRFHQLILSIVTSTKHRITSWLTPFVRLFWYTHYRVLTERHSAEVAGPQPWRLVLGRRYCTDDICGQFF